MADPTTTTCCVCEGGINPLVVCTDCKRHACYICTDPNSRCLSCQNGGLPVIRQGINTGKWVGGSSLDPLPDVTCDFCPTTMQGDMVTFCIGSCLKRFCPDCLSNDAVQCPCPPVEEA